MHPYFSSGLPAFIVAISLGIAGPSKYGIAGDCWLSRTDGFIWAALGPMIAVLLVRSSLNLYN